MSIKCAMSIIGIGVGVPAFMWFGLETNWQAALALFLCMFANNARQYKP